MSQDPWAALEARRQRRHWRAWPWGWAALLLSLGAWACTFMLTVLVMASVGMPGDGSHAMQATAPYLTVTLVLGATTLLGSVIASVLALRLHRQAGGGVAALLLNVLLLAVLLVPAVL
ncbi:hypothetical protein [Stenotrophomonas sp.]|uniref:hypothetical protein n=1 Tax=Stenotrophomonas sp. TaxID=69392 RepID=UPI002FCBDBEC